MKKVLVTGAAGFIGFHLCRRLLAEGHEVVGVDNVNGYYDPALKEARIGMLGKSMDLVRIDIADADRMAGVFMEWRFDIVVNLAAYAGVRYSIENPRAYVDSNVVGFLNVLEGCRREGIQHLVFASSASVYGANEKMPWSPHEGADHPMSLYAATKKADELMAHSYASLYRLPCTGLRFFNVYGPWGRPDSALFRFTRAIFEGRPIDVYNGGRMKRDFTHVDDIVEGVVRVMGLVPVPDPRWSPVRPDPATSYVPYRIYNIGGDNQIELMDFIGIIEKAIGREAVKNFLPMQMGDVPASRAEAEDLREAIGFRPGIPIEEGVRGFVEWYRGYYKDRSG